jgi:hypothetical protein
MDGLTRPGPSVGLSYAGWTLCHLGQFPALGTRCYLRVQVGMPFTEGAGVEEVVAYYDPVGWLLESGARISPDRAFAWRLAG